MKRTSGTNELYKINRLISSYTAAGFLLILFFEPESRTAAALNWYLSFALVFIYFHLILKNLKVNLDKFKNEVLYINYPVNIGLFFLFIFTLISAAIGLLYIINKEAFDTAVILSFIMAFIAIIMPSAILLTFIYFVSPALTVPNLKKDNASLSKYRFLNYSLCALYTAFLLFQGVSAYLNMENFETLDKYKSAELNIRFSENPLKTGADVKPYAQKLMEHVKIEIPFLYTSGAFPFEHYQDAEIFCRSMNARIPNYREVYNIAFNAFDIFGEKYYWTSDKDEGIPLVLKVKNMSYTIERLKKNTKPLLYCAAASADNYGFKTREYFYKTPEIIKAETDYRVNKQLKEAQEEGFKGLDDILEKSVPPKIIRGKKTPLQQKVIKAEKNYNAETVNKDKKLVIFSIKFVPEKIMQELIQKGYNYSPDLDLRPEYEADDAKIDAAIVKNLENIRLCYYPFTDYGRLDINQERQIWQQSFCSPAFTLLSPAPKYISGAEKNTYCQNLSGRLPNIPELAAILKTADSKPIGAKFWTNNSVIDNNKYAPIAAYYKDERFMTAEILDENRSAYAYCIKQASPPSKVIANYQTRFKGYDGSTLAHKYCPSCYYYEVPDTIQK